MKTSVIRKAFFVAMVMMVAGLFSASAQNSREFFFDKKMNDSGKMESKTKYEFVEKGLAQAVYKYEYMYDETNRLIKTEFYKWNETEKEWQLKSCINHIYNELENCVKLEYAIWNKKAKKYNEVSERASYWLDNEGNILSYFMTKENINTFGKFTLAN